MPTIMYPSLIRRLCRRLNSNRRCSPIDILNDDVFLHIFHLYRLADPDESEDKNGMLNFTWDHQRWWYKLARVCRQWRNIILESPSRLDLHLYCTSDVPVADMLAHSPPLPLTIYYAGWKIATKDEAGILLALSQRDRVRHIYFSISQNVGKFVTAMNDQFPILERMYIHSETKVSVVLPETFQVPNLRHLQLSTAYLPIRSPLLTTTAAGLVTLELLNISAPFYFPPSYILSRLSLMAQLERLSITFDSPFPNHYVENQLHQTPDMTTLPNLCRFLFRGTATYLEGLVPRISAPSLSILQVRVNLFGQGPLTVPRLCQLIQSSESLSFNAVQLTFGASAVSLHAAPWKWDTPLMLQIKCGRLDWQVAFAVPFFGTLSPVLSFVEFRYDDCYRQPELLNDVDRSQWRELLRPFTNVKAIHMKRGLIRKILCSLPSDDGDPLLPNIEEVGYSEGSDTITTFCNERQVSGHPVSLRRVYRWKYDIPENL